MTDTPIENMTQLVSALERESEIAEDAWERLRKHQRFALDYYEGQRLGNEQDGRSQIVLPDVQETIDYMTISVVRPFVSASRIVEFEASDEQDEEAAQEATAAIHYLFERKQDGFRVLTDFIVDGLRERIGILETTCITTERAVTETVIITDPVELEQLGDVEVESSEELGDGTMRVNVRSVISEKRYIEDGVPTEEFRFNVDAQHEDESDYIARLRIVTRSTLVDMGFDREQAYAVKGHDYDLRNDRVSSERYDDDQYDFGGRTESSDALQKVLLRKEYIRADIDDDGIAELVEVYRVEKDILIWSDSKKPAVKPVDEQPFVVYSPFPRPHRLVGYSLAEKVMDIQLLRTTIARQLIDGMYLANMPRPLVNESGASPNTIADLLSPVPGAPIRYTGDAPQPYQNSFDASKSLTVLEWATGERESRTGITRLNQGIDADALNKTATGTAMMQAQGQQHEEFIVRVVANALMRLFAKKYRLLRREGAKFSIKVDGKYKQVDASRWPDDFSLNIMVGLGTGSKEKRVAGRMALVEIMAQGTQLGEVTPAHRFKMVDGLVRDLGIGQGDDYWVDPDVPEIDPMTGEPSQKQEKPDPEIAKVYADAALKKQELDGAQAMSAAKMKIAEDEAAHKMKMDRNRAAFEAELARDKAEFEAQLALDRADVEQQLARKKAANDLPDNRPGGSLAA